MHPARTEGPAEDRTQRLGRQAAALMRRRQGDPEFADPPILGDAETDVADQRARAAQDDSVLRPRRTARPLTPRAAMKARASSSDDGSQPW
ncbi:hypothetical protein WPS_16770 [Vulcanimicrobium alpinum]|uniref:Uncharacterized protein n=1 Tax=Vulcanimicrobium alpinum TaxID=3016050 RepID=A0AAN2C9U5_UNVUL|nr:hypothetical protein WPS_16770 [Vulcanimicrobium alpinum]